MISIKAGTNPHFSVLFVNRIIISKIIPVLSEKTEPKIARFIKLIKTSASNVLTRTTLIWGL